MFSVWRRVVLVACVAVGSLNLSGPARADGASGPFFTCQQAPSPVYSMVGNVPIWVHTWSDFPSGASTNLEGAPRNCTPYVGTHNGVVAHYPNDGAVAEALGPGGTVEGRYVVVGGAPVRVNSWSGVGLSDPPAGLQYFDYLSLPSAEGPDQIETPDHAFQLAGYFSHVAANAYFRGPGGTIYRTDSVGHPSVVPSAPAAAVLPTVDQYAINTCDRMNCDPWGPVSVEVAGDGLLHLYGYALDGMTTQQLTVRVDLPGGSVTIPADQPDPEVGALYGRSGNYGFDRVISAPAGHYQVCTTFNGFAPGATYTPIGCSTVDVPGVKPARVHRPKVKAIGGHRLRVTWKPPNDGGSAISEYLLRTSSGVKKQISGTRHSIVLKHVPGGRAVSVKVRAINGVGMGGFSKPSAMVVVR